jgi:hypothetical protein
MHTSSQPWRGYAIYMCVYTYTQKQGRVEIHDACNIAATHISRRTDDDRASVHALANVIVDLTNNFHLHSRQIEQTEALACAIKSQRQCCMYIMCVCIYIYSDTRQVEQN